MKDDIVDLTAVFDMLRRQFRTIVLTTLICCALAVIYLVSVTPIYTSSALIKVDPAQKDLLDPDAQNVVNQSAANARVESEVEILRSDAIALNVVQEENLLSDPEFGPQVGLLEKLERLIGIERDRNESPQVLVRQTVDRFQQAIDIRRRGLSYLIQVSVSSESPERATELTNALAESYIEEQLASKIEGSLAARDILQLQINASRTSLAQSETALDEFIQDNILRIQKETGRVDLSSLVSLLQETENSRLKSEVQIRQSEESLRTRNWADLVAGLEDEALTALERQRAGIERRLGRVVEGSQPEIDLRAELASLEARLEEQAALEIGRIQSGLADLTANEDSLRRQLRNTLVAGQLPADILAEVFEIQQDAAIARTQYQNLLARLNDVETRAGVQIADSQIVSPALLPTSPTFPNFKLVLFMAALLGGGLGGFLALLREFVIGGFTSVEQLQAAAQAPVASTIPLRSGMSKAQSPADAVIREPLSVYAESLRRLRASIDQSMLNRQDAVSLGNNIGGTVILVTSSLPREGKTTTALSLARTYALAGKMVLLIDADLRKPSVHTALGLDPAKGFTDFLADKEPIGKLKEYLTPDPDSPVVTILGKSRSALPTDRLLSSPDFQRVIETARKKYDYIVIDTPPLLPVVDGRYLAQLADVVVMLVRWASTSQADLRASLPPLRDSMLEDTPLHIVLSQKTGGRRRSYDYDYAYGP